MRFQQEDDRISLRQVAVWVVPATLVAILGVVLATLLADAFGRELDASGFRSDDNRSLAPEAIGNIENTSFEKVPTPSERYRLQEQHLQNYGWVDQESGIIHVPVERAMEMYRTSAQGKPDQHANNRPDSSEARDAQDRTP